MSAEWDPASSHGMSARTTRPASTTCRVIAIGLLLVGCASSANSGLTSKYLNPEPGRLYKYGNFCGPGIPFPEKDRTAENATRMAALPAFDTLDAACKVHDLCYVRYGNDTSSCDWAFIGALLGDLKPLGDPLKHQCQRQRSEIYHSLYHKKHEDAATGLTFAMGSIITVPFAMFEVGYGYAVNNRGFPDEPGACNYRWSFSNNATRTGLENLNDLEEACLSSADKSLCASTSGASYPFEGFNDFISYKLPGGR